MSSKIEVVAYANGDELSNLLDDRTAAVAGIADGWRGTGLVRLSDHQSEVDRLTEWARANQQLAQGAMDKLIDALTDCDRLKMHLADHRTTLDAMSSCADSAAPVVERQPEFGDAYQGAREDLSIWKRRALEAEAKVREQDQIIDRLGDALNDENGPAHMGEPVVERHQCCTPTPEEEQLLANGDYTPEELWGGNRPTCPKCINTASPELAELQATIARLTVEIDRLKGEPVAAECNTCGGKRIVDDGELVCSSGGIPYENGPIKLVKDCPACTSPAPVSIVLPERFVDFETDNYAQGWNACLDQIKELNK